MSGGRLLAYVLLGAWVGSNVYSAQERVLDGYPWPGTVVQSVLALVGIVVLLRMVVVDVKDGVLR